LARQAVRAGLVVVGIVLAVIGAVLLFVPVVPQGSDSVPSSGTNLPFLTVSVLGFSITGSIPVAVTWTATARVTVVAATCSAKCTANFSTISGIVLQSGTSGSFTLNQPNGGEMRFGAVSSSSPFVGALNASGSPFTVTFTLTTALSTVGTVLVVIGSIVLILGAVVKSTKAKMAAAAAPMSYMPATTPPPAVEPPMSLPSPPMAPSYSSLN
jgi:hypothetical protein